MVLLHILTINNASTTERYKIADSTSDFNELIRKYSYLARYNTLNYNIVELTEDDRDCIVKIREDITELEKQIRNLDLLEVVRSAIGSQLEKLYKLSNEAIEYELEKGKK